MENNLDLLLQAKNGDDHAKEKLIEQNLGLVWSVARRFTGRGYDIEDLFQIGCIGLIKCIDKFSFEYDVKFSTYAVPLIQGEIRRFLRDSGAIKVSRSLKEMNMKVEQYRQKIKKEKGYEPEITEIAAALSFDASASTVSETASSGATPITALTPSTVIPSESALTHWSKILSASRSAPSASRAISCSASTCARIPSAVVISRRRITMSCTLMR